MKSLTKWTTVPRWLLIAYAFYMPYSAISRYCDFKQAVGWETTCGCKQ